jgi:hypothetical protein
MYFDSHGKQALSSILANYFLNICRVNLGVPNKRFLRGCVTLFSCLLKESGNEKKFPWGNTRQVATHCPLTKLTATVGFHKIYETAIPYNTAAPNPTGQRQSLFHIPVRLYAELYNLCTPSESYKTWQNCDSRTVWSSFEPLIRMQLAKDDVNPFYEWIKYRRCTEIMETTKKLMNRISVGYNERTSTRNAVCSCSSLCLHSVVLVSVH